MVIAKEAGERVAMRQDVCVGSPDLSDRSRNRPARTVGFSNPAALRLVIRGLLYRLLIICAHLQRHSVIAVTYCHWPI